MELCWENLDNLYLTKAGYLRKRVGCKSNAYVYKDKCKYCGKPFLAIRAVAKGKVTVNEFCSHSCCRTNRYCSPETRKKLSVSNTGKKRSRETKKKLSDVASRRPVECNPGYKGGVVKSNIPLYNTYGRILEEFEKIRIYMLRIGCTVYKTFQVRCHNSDCKKWFKPTIYQVKNRICAFKGQFTLGSQNDFYCIEECKQNCSTYNRRTRRKDEPVPDKPYTSEEYKLFRKVVMERENYTCEYCGKPATDLHHEQTVKENPMLALDLDYAHACCEECHYKYGHKTGTECSTGSLANKIC